MPGLTIDEKFLRLKNDSKKQWEYIVKLQYQIVATQTFQFILMANLREFVPPLHSKIVDGLDGFLEKTKVKEQFDSSIFSEYFQLLSDAELSKLSEFHKQLYEMRESEPPPDDDLYQ